MSKTIPLALATALIGAPAFAQSKSNLTTDQQVELSEIEDPNCVLNANRPVVPKVEHPRAQWQKGEVEDPSSTLNKDRELQASTENASHEQGTTAR
jgi:hypothetical protein